MIFSKFEIEKMAKYLKNNLAILSRVQRSPSFSEAIRHHLASKKSALPNPVTIVDINAVKVSLKDLVCYLSLLEGGRPEDKLECKNTSLLLALS